MSGPRSALVSILLAILLGACAPHDDAPAGPEPERRVDRAAERPAPAPATAAVAELTSAEAPPGSEVPAAAETVSERASTGPEAGEQPRAAETDSLERAARRALAAASRVAPGQDDCDTAYARLAALVASIERDAPGRVRDLPPQDRFLAICTRLPPAMQRCLVVEYAIDNEDDCAREHGALDPELRGSLDALMAGDG